MTVQMIKQGDKPEWAVIPYDAYLHALDVTIEDLTVYA